jgi:hypothetical protein
MSYGRGMMTWPEWRTPARLGLCLLAVGACSSDEASGYMDDQPPNGVCETDTDPDCLTGTATDGDSSTGSGGATSTTGATAMTTSSSATGGDADQCEASAECPNSQLCVAEFMGDKRGPYACVSACLELNDEAMWCADAAACCTAGATCTDRGFCVLAGGDTGTTG